MYDDRQKWSSSFGSMAGQKAVECLLDFSRGPDSMLVTDFKHTEYNVSGRTLSFSDGKMESNTRPDREESVAVETSANQTRKSEPKRRAVCSFCGKEFSHLGDHNKHRRRHTGERPYPCDLCPLRFAHASNLARHRRLHSGEKPFSCTSCGRGFARKDKLNAHAARMRCGASSPLKREGQTRSAGPPED